jgi:transcriptional regulator with XRE-family HTH domain
MSLGNTLRQARTARQISLNQAALETRIRQSVLESLEHDDFTALPPRPFLRGLLRNYAVYLNLEPDAVLEEFDVATGAKAPAAPTTTGDESTPPVKAAPSTPPEALIFPAFETPSLSQTHPRSEPPPLEPETTFIVAPEIEGYVPEPTPPLNLPQEPPSLAQRIGSTRIPEAVALVALAVALFGLISVGFDQFNQLRDSFGAAATPRPSPSPEMTALPGSTRTAIPTLAQTVEAFTPVAFTGAQQTPTRTGATLSPTAPLSQTLEIPTNALMALAVQAEGAMEAWIVADGQEVFNGPLQNETRTWTARSQLFMQIKNIEQGRVALNGRRILPRDQQERTTLVRAWVMSPKGTPVAVPPTPFPNAVVSPLAPTAAPSKTLSPTPSATFALSNSPSITPRVTRTLTPTLTLTRALTLTPTQTISATLTTTRIP